MGSVGIHGISRLSGRVVVVGGRERRRVLDHLFLDHFSVGSNPMEFPNHFSRGCDLQNKSETHSSKENAPSYARRDNEWRPYLLSGVFGFPSRNQALLLVSIGEFRVFRRFQRSHRPVDCFGPVIDAICGSGGCHLRFTTNAGKSKLVVTHLLKRSISTVHLRIDYTYSTLYASNLVVVLVH